MTGQSATLRALDAAILEGMVGIGFADTATYAAPGGGAAVPCTVMVDEAVQVFGDAGEVVGTRTLVTLFQAEVANPLRGGTVVADGSTYKLDEEDARDQSMTRWVVVHG